MAAHVTAGIYGTMEGSPPFGTGLGSPTRNLFWDTAVQMSFPTDGTVFHPVLPGVRVGNTSNYIYSIIEVLPTGLTTPGHGTKYASNASVATLASGAG